LLIAREAFSHDAAFATLSFRQRYFRTWLSQIFSAETRFSAALSRFHYYYAFDAMPFSSPPLPPLMPPFSPLPPLRQTLFLYWLFQLFFLKLIRQLIIAITLAEFHSYAIATFSHIFDSFSPAFIILHFHY
jgi:hypothetical protein